MKSIVKGVYILFSTILLLYLSVPNVEFPLNPTNSLQSNEPGDVEAVNRLAYFTNLDRSSVVEHYLSYYRAGLFSLIPPLTLRLNYPPEEAGVIIRDQTRSSYLEEVAHPMRESIFINGFIPKEEKDNIYISERNWAQKVTVKYIPSNVIARLIIGMLALLSIKVLFDLYTSALKILININLIRKS